MCTRDLGDVVADYAIKDDGNSFASLAPSANRRQPQTNCTAELSGVKVLMSNGVAPTVEVFEVTNSIVVPATLRSHSIPKCQAKAIEVGTNGAGGSDSHDQVSDEV